MCVRTSCQWSCAIAVHTWLAVVTAAVLTRERVDVRVIQLECKVHDVQSLTLTGVYLRRGGYMLQLH